MLGLTNMNRLDQLQARFLISFLLTAFFYLTQSVSASAQSPTHTVAETRATILTTQDVLPLFIEGYAGEVSYAPGDQLTLHTSTTADTYSVTISRLSAEKKVVHQQKDIAGGVYAIPENASSHGCNWPVSLTIPIPQDWQSGYYHIEFQVADSGGKFTHRGRRTASGEAYFVLRSAKPGSTSKILLQLATNTYNAYNNWGGSSLYAFHGRAGIQGHRVSFKRPPSSQFPNWEQPFVTWAEANGYQLEYAANLDLESRPEILNQYKLILSVGHDEYWSTPMRDNLEAFITQGGNVAFFSGNTCCWQVRTEADGKDLTCWKQRFASDPLFPTSDHQLLSTLWSHHLVKRPENQLTGVGFLFGGYHRSHGQYMDGPAAYRVHRPDHWIFEGTNLKRNAEFGGKDTIVGYECDGCEFVLENGLPIPTGSDGTPKDFLILASCPAKWHPDDCLWYERFPADRQGAAIFGTYTHGGTVVTVGSTDWAHGLRGQDSSVVRITQNILDRLSR
jgi:hypothetical protein